MPHFTKAQKAWNTPEFDDTLKQEIIDMDINQLHLQQALTQSSHVSDSKINVVILSTSEDRTSITAKAGIFFYGIIAGSCCSDDPTPIDEVQEYCDLEFCISKETADTTISLLTP